MRIILDGVIMLDRHRLDGQMYLYLQLFFNSAALRCWSFSEKTLYSKYLYSLHKNYYYFWKSNIPVINLLVDSRNMIKFQKYEFVKK